MSREAHQAESSRSTVTPFRTIGGHVGKLVSRDGVNRLARFGAAVLLARALTLEDYGVLNTGIAAAGIALTVTNLGLPDLGAREVGARPLDVFGRSRLAGRILAARLTLLGIVTAVAIATVAVMAPQSLAPAVVVAGIALTMATNADWLLRGLERMAELGNAVALSGLTVLAGSLLLFVVPGSATAGLTVILLGEIVGSAAAWYWAGTSPRLELDRSELSALLRRSWPLALSSIAMYSYYANIDTILLAAMRSVEEAGLYSAPYRVFLGLNAISIHTAYAVLPMLTRGVEAGDHAPAFAALRRAVRYLLIYGALLLAGAELAGSAMLGALFGSEFSEMGDVFVVLCIAIMWFSVGYPVGYALLARDENRRFLAGSATGGILNLGLNLVLIPRFGPTGAAAATAGAFVAACLVWLWGNRLLGRETVVEIAAMTTISLAALACLIEPALMPGAVALTVLVACAVAWPLRMGRADNQRMP